MASGIYLCMSFTDCFWMKEFHWCDFQWDQSAFPDPEGMLRRLKERGLRICLINPYIAQRSALFAEGIEKGYFKRPNGDVWQWDLWQAGMTIVDFTNQTLMSGIKAILSGYIGMGLTASKLILASGFHRCCVLRWF